MDIIQLINLESHKLRLPRVDDKIFKDECVYSFDSPFSEKGLYVNLLTFQGVGADFLMMDSTKTGCKLYLFEKWDQIVRINVEETKGGDEKTKQPSKLAIGVEGGFVLEPQFDIVKEHSLALLLTDGSIQYYRFEDESNRSETEKLNEIIRNICKIIIENEGMRAKLSNDKWENEDERFISKYAEHLIQENNGKKISNDPSTWKCELSGDTQNLWLNLSTGYIGGGRKNWDGTGGSGAGTFILDISKTNKKKLNEMKYNATQ
jgi:ubiquitin carboxyl-terminal hydrolase 5/13